MFGSKLLEEGWRGTLPDCVHGPVSPILLGFPMGLQLVYFDYRCAEVSKTVLTDEVKMLERSAGGSYQEKKV